jgi:predicted RNA-binding protein with TRAM domain
LRSGRKDNPVHNYLSMRAFAIDRIAGGGTGSFVYEGYVTIIALAEADQMSPRAAGLR